MNRVLLLIVGAVLLAGGLAVTGRSRGVWEDVLRSPDKALITRSQADRLVAHDWWWWPAIGVPAALTVVCLWWFLAQFRRRPLRMLTVRETGDLAGGGPSGLGTGFGMVGDEADTLTVGGQALAAAVEEDLEHVDGVEHGSARFVRHRRGPRLELAVRAEAGAEPRAVLTEIRDEVVEHSRSAVGLERLPVRVELRTARGLPARKVE
jgi:hypothetical protein